jgi:hypothetical protein
MGLLCGLRNLVYVGGDFGGLRSFVVVNMHVVGDVGIMLVAGGLRGFVP